MTELTRRGLMAGAGAAGAALALPLQATAGAPAAGKQVPSFFRSKLGDFELTVVSDGARPIPLPPRFVLNVPNEEVLKAAEAAYMPKGTVFAPFNPLLVNTGRKLVLIDTGYGPIAPTVGLLPQSLAAAGVDPKSIDIVADLAHARRPHQRHQEPGWLARLPERRDQGAGGRLGILDGRRQHGEGAGGLRQGVVRLRPKNVR